jgi:hypothetical protein
LIDATLTAWVRTLAIYEEKIIPSKCLVKGGLSDNSQIKVMKFQEVSGREKASTLLVKPAGKVI